MVRLKPADRNELIRRICKLLETGMSLQQACTADKISTDDFMILVRRFGRDGTAKRGRACTPDLPVDLDSDSARSDVGGCGSTSSVDEEFTLSADFDPATGVSLQGHVSWRAPWEDNEEFDEENGGEEETDEELEQRREDWEEEREDARKHHERHAESDRDYEVLAEGLRSIEEICNAVDDATEVLGRSARFSSSQAEKVAREVFPWLPESIPEPDETEDEASGDAASNPAGSS